MKEAVIIGHGFNNIDGTMRNKIFSSQVPHAPNANAAGAAPPAPAPAAAPAPQADGAQPPPASNVAAAPLGGAGNPFQLAFVAAPQSAQDKQASAGGNSKTISALESDIRFQLVDDYESFRKLTEASLGISSNFNNVSVSVKGTFTHQFEFNYQDVFYFIRIKTKHHVDVLEEYTFVPGFIQDLARLYHMPVPVRELQAVDAPANTTINGINPVEVPAVPPIPADMNVEIPPAPPPALPAFLNIKTADDFYSRYGDEVIDSVVYGSELSILVQFICKNEDDKRTVKVALGVKTPWFGIDGSYAREVEKQLKDIAVFGVYTSKGRKGSTAFSVIQDLTQLNRTVEDFTKSDIDPAQINFTTKSWKELLGSNTRLKVITDVTAANLSFLKEVSRCHDYCKTQLKKLEFQNMQLNNNRDYEKIRNAQLVYNYLITKLIELANRVTDATTLNITYACAVGNFAAINTDLVALGAYITDNTDLPPELMTAAKIPEPGAAPVTMPSNFSIALPSPYVSDLSNCRVILAFDAQIKTHTLLPSCFDFISQVTKQKQKLAINLDHILSTTEYISCQLRPVNGVTLRNDFTIKLKSPNNTRFLLGSMKTKSVKHAVHTHPDRENDRYIVISMDQAYSVVYGHHKPPVELHVEDPVDNSTSEKNKKKQAKPDVGKPHQVSNHYLMFKLPKVNKMASVNNLAPGSTALTVSLVVHSKPTV